MKLGFDLDGVVSNMAKALVNKTNEKFGIDITEDYFINHNLFKNHYSDKSGLDHEIAKFMTSEVVHNKSVLYELEPYEDVQTSFRELRKGGHKFYFITARRKDEYEVTINWLRRNNIPFDALHHIPSIKGDSRKGLMGRSLNLDFYIDDQYKHIENMYRYKNRWRKGLALFTRPWNVNEVVDGTICIRVDNWDALIRHLGIHNR